jgi:hypothetical protein
MDTLDARHAVVDLSTYQEIAGALGVDLDARLVLIKRKRYGGGDEEIVVHYPSGVRIVRRR